MSGKTVAGTLATVITVLGGSGTAIAGSPGLTESLGSSGGIEYVRAKFPSVVSQAGPTAACDAGDSTVGGGGSINGDPATARLVTLIPAATPDDGWTTEGTADVGARTVAAYAICGGDAVETVSSTDNYPAGSEFLRAELCPGDGVSLSGGAETSGGQAAPVATFPGDDAPEWRIAYATNADTSVTTGVQCSTSYPRTVRERSADVKSGDSGKIIRRCAKGHEVLGGGFVAEQPNTQLSFETVGTTSRPWDDPRDAKKVPEDGWLVKVHNFGGRVELSAYAVCGA